MSELREVTFKVGIFLISDDVDSAAKKIESQLEHLIFYKNYGEDIDIRHVEVINISAERRKCPDAGKSHSLDCKADKPADEE